jgi:hypothetical protein
MASTILFKRGWRQNPTVEIRANSSFTEQDAGFGELSAHRKLSRWPILEPFMNYGTLFCPWVRAVVDLGQLRGGQLRVALGGGEAFVAQQLLDGAEVGAFLQ